MPSQSAQPSPAEALSPQKQMKPKKKRPSAENNEALINVLKDNPNLVLKEAIELASYPAAERTARKRLKEANITLKPQKPKTKAKKGRKMWVVVSQPQRPKPPCRWLQKLEKKRQQALAAENTAPKTDDNVQ